MIHEKGGHLTRKQVMAARADLFRDKYAIRFDDWAQVVSAAAEKMRAPIPDLLAIFAQHYSNNDANMIYEKAGFAPFAGSLCWLTPSLGATALRETDVTTLFQPDWFIRAPTNRFDEIHKIVARNLASDIAETTEPYISAQPLETLGQNNIRTVLLDVVNHPEDHHGTILPSLTLTFGPTDWYHIQAFNNRMLDDEEFRQQVYRTDWIPRALPECSGDIPSYVCTHIILTGPDYLVVTQRPRKQDVRYFPSHWSVTLEENMQGPREVRERNVLVYKPGDTSLHETALRGLEEELGLTEQDVADIRLLGLFVEGPHAAVAALFWATTPLSWSQIPERHRNSKDPEARIIAREPLTTENLAELCLLDTYDPSTRAGATFHAPYGKDPTAGNIHPTARGRILRYLLEDAYRHPPDSLVEAFRGLGMR
ncbi:MAG: hypothetical protein AB7F89_06735 [Pirellulaceae bacterium]